LAPEDNLVKSQRDSEITNFHISHQPRTCVIIYIPALMQSTLGTAF